MKPSRALVALILALTGTTGAGFAQDARTSPPSLDALVADGATIYKNRCAKCHGKNGQGQQHSHDSAPRLAGNFARLSVEEMTVQVIRGGAYMPPFAGLSDRDIAAVTTYVRNSFGNRLGVATEGEIAEVRRQMKPPPNAGNL